MRIIELLFRNNPWWSEEEDYTYEKWKSMKIRWKPKWIREISLKPFSLNILVGPRQVGKTTGIKILIHELLERGSNPYSIFYLDLDFINDMATFKEAIDKYLEIRKSKDVNKSYIFLDEVTTVRDWWKLVRAYIDHGYFKNDVLTVTGSSSLKIKGDIELFPGRRGYGRDINVLPLNFREFLKIHGVEVKLTGDIIKDISVLEINNDVPKLFKKYIDLGGYPLSINSFPDADRAIIHGLESEILRLGYRLELVRSIISTIFRLAPSPLSYSTIGREVGVSYKTVEHYIDILKNLFILDIANYIEGKRIVWRKEKKFFFLDPFLVKTLSLYYNAEYLESAFYEWLVQSHLKRRYGEVYYYRNNYEIDCIIGDLRIEIKTGKPHRRYPKDVIILDIDNLPYFLAAI